MVLTRSHLKLELYLHFKEGGSGLVGRVVAQRPRVGSSCVATEVAQASDLWVPVPGLRQEGHPA